MPSFTDTAISLYRRLFGTPETAGRLADGIETVLDGDTAVAIAEACIADTAVMGNGGGLAWLSEMERNGRNMHGGALSALDSESPRGALAAASGLAMAGQRATVFLNGRELAAAQDLLVSAAGQRLPLVIHLTNRALAAQGTAAGSGHEALHQAADSGSFILVASNVQQSVDFTLIARRVAELSLTPGMVVLDGEQASAPQEVKLPSLELVRRFIGRGDEQIDAPSEAQKLLFGEQRRRIPQRHSLDRPVLNGALHADNSFALGAAAGATWFEKQVAELLEQSFAEFARLTGREYSALTEHNAEKAERLLLVMGGAVENAIAAAEQLRRKEKIKIGVIGLHALRPFPVERLATLLAGKRAVTVMERCDAPLASATPLLRELRPTLPQASNLQAAIYGLGGLPLRGADLLQLGRTTLDAPRYLGIDFHNADRSYPKRQALLDTLSRHYPGLENLGLRGEKSADLRAAESISLAIHRLACEETGLANEAGSLLHQLLGGQLRSQIATSWESWGAALCDRLHHAPGNLRDPGIDAPADLLLLTTARLSIPALLDNLTAKGSVLLDGEVSTLSTALQQAIQKRKLHLYTTAAIPGESSEERRERLLGSLFGLLLAEGRLGEIKARRLHSTREEALGHLDRARREILLNAFDYGLDELQKIGSDVLNVAGGEAQKERITPAAVRHLGDDSGRYDSLPRFQDQVGVLYRDGATNSLTADPYLALDSIPPLTALFRDHSLARRQLPRFDAANCTACGKCWANCPDSAIGAVAIAPKALLETGIDLAGVSGLRAISGKLATGIATLARKGEAATTADELLTSAWTWLEQKTPPAEDRREALAGELEQVKQALAGLPLSVTEPLFYSAEKAQKESGELLTLAINPDTCKGCGLCAGLCADNALEMVPSDAADNEVAHRLWQLWQQTPDTNSATTERLMRDGAMDPMAAQMLSRHCAFALSGGDGAEAGSGEKIALRQVLAATEYRQQPLLHRLIGDLAELRKGLAAKIRDTLADALPSGDLERLSRSLEKVHTREAGLDAFIGDNDELLEGSGVDAPHLRRLIKLAKGISELHWLLAQGEHGLGRARYGLAFASGSAAAWAGAFPWNPFHAPVVLEMTGNAPQMAAGLLQGQVNDTLAQVRLLRRARAELDPRNAKETDSLPRWEDLDDEERLLCPPLWLVGNDQSLGGEGFAQVAWLLNSGLPIKILVLADLDLGLGSHGIADTALTARRDARGDLALMALSQRNAYVAQGSFAAPQHLNDAVRGMLRFPGPALLRLHTPSPANHGFAADLTVQQAERAVADRALPLFVYDPQAGGVFGSRLSLEGNPQPHALWAEGQTPAHWALGEARFDPRLPALHGNAPAPTELTAWLALAPAQRSGKTPYIAVQDANGHESRYTVDPTMAVMVERLGNAWRTLQELAGLVTPFTSQVEAEAQQNLASAHQAELDALRREYEEKLRALEAGMQGEMHDQITKRLLELAGYE